MFSIPIDRRYEASGLKLVIQDGLWTGTGISL